MNRHVIFVTSALHGGGAERVIATLANHLVRSGDHVTVLMVAGTESVYRLEPGVDMISVGQPSHGNPVTQIKRVFSMRKFFRKHRDSVMISFGTSINLFTIMASLGLQNKVIVSERNDPNQCSYRILRDFIYSFGRNFVFQTEDAKACFPEKIQRKSVVIPNPIRNDLPEIYDGIREKKIAAVGRLEPQKNHKLLLEAFAGFHRKFPEYELHIFGKGGLEQELRQQAVDLGIGDKVVFEGFCSNVLERIRTWSMYVLSSDYEGISNSLMEAMALGLPCISTDCPIGGSAMCIENGKNGLLVPLRDKEALRRAMETLAENGKAAEELGREAVKVRSIFAEDRIIAMWSEYMEKGEIQHE